MGQRRREYDLFHIIDHSYAHLAHQLPARSTVITCHDLDAFTWLWQPNCRIRSKVLQTIARSLLSGLREAAVVTCPSFATRDELLTSGLLPPHRVTVVHNGVDPTCSPIPDQDTDSEIALRLGPAHADLVDILHVGSTIQRKRIDILLRVFACVRRDFPRARLIRVGGAFTAPQTKLVSDLNLFDSIVVLPFLKRAVLAAMYRRATIVLQPSESEGFGLPVVEAMACGTPVVASNLSVMREVGGAAATYCPVDDVSSWGQCVTSLISERQLHSERWIQRRTAAIAQAAKFSWSEHVQKMVEVYLGVLRV